MELNVKVEAELVRVLSSYVITKATAAVSTESTFRALEMTHNSCLSSSRLPNAATRDRGFPAKIQLRRKVHETVNTRCVHFVVRRRELKRQ